MRAGREVVVVTRCSGLPWPCRTFISISDLRLILKQWPSDYTDSIGKPDSEDTRLNCKAKVRWIIRCSASLSISWQCDTGRVTCLLQQEMETSIDVEVEKNIVLYCGAFGLDVDVMYTCSRRLSLIYCKSTHTKQSRPWPCIKAYSSCMCLKHQQQTNKHIRTMPETRRDLPVNQTPIDLQWYDSVTRSPRV